jgi:hypothetical protein
MIESARIAKWLTATLKADTALAAIVGTRVVEGRPPSSTALPYVTFNQQASRDVQGNGTHRLMTRPLYQVKVIAPSTSNAQSYAAAERIDEILQDTANEVFEDVVFHVRRESEVNYQETGPDPQIVFTHRGGIYRIDTQPAG